MTETALITGASGGLGEHYARLCAERGMHVILVARSTAALTALATELQDAHGITALAVTADLALPDGVDTTLATVDASGLAVTLLINNAGSGSYGTFADDDPQTQTTMIELNMHALTRLTRAILPGMMERGHGRVLNVASIAAFLPGPLMAVYYATKAYVLHLSLALADEVRGSGVTVTCVCPGPTTTGFEQRAGLTQSKLFRHATMSADSVTRSSLDACLLGKPLFIPGARNKLAAFATRFIPRMWTASIARHAQARA